MAYQIWLEIWLTVTSKSEHTVLAFIAAFNYPHTTRRRTQFSSLYSDFLVLLRIRSVSYL